MRRNPYQLEFMEKRNLALEIPAKCLCGGKLVLGVGPIGLYGIKAYYEVSCQGCDEHYHLYFNKIGVPDMQLRIWNPPEFFGRLVWPVNN